jgi:hypothetical protein
MQSAVEGAGKRQYSTPRLMVHGTLEEVTKQLVDKNVGASDGLVLAGIGPIGVVS